MSSRHRVALIGFFSSVAGARASLPPSCELVGLCDIRADLLAKCRAEAPDLFVTDDFRKIASMPNCDTVVAWTPNDTHRDIAVACLQGGKHVFIEKPMGVTLEQGYEILAAEKASGKYVGVDLELRWGKQAQWIKQIIDAGEIGKIVQVELDHHRGNWLHDSPGGIYRTKKSHSGLMRMEGIHNLDFLRFLSGEIKSVHAFALPNTLLHYEFPDNMTLMIEFESGARGRFTSSHNKVGYIYGNDPRATDLGHSQHLVICGDKGMIRVDGWRHRIDVFHYGAQPAGTNSRRIDFVRSIDFSRLGDPWSATHDISGHRRDFMQRMADGKPPFQRAEDAHRSERLAFAIDAAACPDGRQIDCSRI